MAKEKLKKFHLTAFTPSGDYLAALSSKGTAKVWNTDSGDLLAECKPSDGDSDICYSCIACSFIGKKRRKEQGTCLLALGKVDGSILAIDIFTSETKWTASYPGGVIGLSFAKKGHLLRVVGQNGMASEISADTGEVLKEFKISKKSISCLAFSHDEKFLAIVVGTKLRIVSWEDGKEVLKFSGGLGNVQYLSTSDDAKTLVTSDGGKLLQVWRCDLNSGTVSSGPTIPMRHTPLHFECHHGCTEKDDLAILAVSGSGAAYVWNLETSSENELQPTKITIKTNKGETDKQNSESPKKNRVSIISSRIQPMGADKEMKALVAYGSIEHPEFSVLNINNSGENIILNVADEAEPVNEHGISDGKALPVESKKSKKRRAESDSDLPTTTDKVDFADQGEVADGVVLDDDDVNEPTMGEKLASLNLVDENKSKSAKELEASVPAMPPSADSVHVLLKQALHADDRTLLLDCLYTQDEKVITKSISQLNPSNVLKLLQSLISIIESRGALVACAIPWLKCLLLQHATGIMSQESSFQALNSLYQMIESRISTFKSAIQLSSSLDILYSGVMDEVVEESQTVPVIFEDKDSDEESEDAMDIEDEKQSGEENDSDRDNEGIDDLMSE
ncbi:WD repeat-containing protein 43-like isoform X1 [Senna tora]|uniref:WD repeat-containing protein 43-like isoform X1 n=1 Tax=Senna tora TaxID=362788 RepID=A0A834T2I3_9FABA|nr:WD repeat-containing protein 43-like isoform X1 [Senna tora]